MLQSIRCEIEIRSDLIELSAAGTRPCSSHECESDQVVSHLATLIQQFIETLASSRDLIRIFQFDRGLQLKGHQT